MVTRAVRQGIKCLIPTDQTNQTNQNRYPKIKRESGERLYGPGYNYNNKLNIRKKHREMRKTL